MFPPPSFFTLKVRCVTFGLIYEFYIGGSLTNCPLAFKGEHFSHLSGLSYFEIITAWRSYLITAVGLQYSLLWPLLICQYYVHNLSVNPIVHSLTLYLILFLGSFEFPLLLHYSGLIKAAVLFCLLKVAFVSWASSKKRRNGWLQPTAKNKYINK